MDFLAAIPFDQILIQTINGIVTGMILALVASGLTLIFGIMDVVNFAHGELFMLGAYVGVLVMAATGNFWLALVLSVFLIGLLGAGIHLTTLRPLLGRDPLTTILATFGVSLVLQNYALWQFGPVARKIDEPFTGHFNLFYLEYPYYRLVIAGLSAAIIGGLWLFLKFGSYGIWIRATTQDRVMAQAMGIPVPRVLTAVFAIGAGMAAASGVLFGPLVGVNHAMGLDWVLKAFIVVVVGGMGNLGGSILASIFISLLEAYASLVVSPAQAVIASFVVLILTLLFRPTGLFVPTPEMTDSRHRLVYWTGFCAIVALLVVAPLVLPEFWRRFLTEILIWGLLAMSSDILIGYTGIVSFGHSAFFGLGMYCAAAALLLFKPASLWLAIAFGLVGAAAVAAFVAYFSTRLRDIYFAITTLIFSQIFYVVIFTWTEVTGGENGLTFSRPRLSIPFLYEQPFTSETLHWFVLAIVVISYLILRRITQSPFGMVLQSIRENEARTRAIGYPVERYKIVAVMLSGLFAGLAGVLYALQNRFAAPDFVYFLISGEAVIYNVMGGIGTLVGPIVGAGFFLLLREGFSRYPQFAPFLPPVYFLIAAGALVALALVGRRLGLGRFWLVGAAGFLVLCYVYPTLPEFYLIPVGLIFIAIVIFLPQGILGFARRWLNK